MVDAKDMENYRELRRALRVEPLRYVNTLFAIILTLYGVGVLLATLTVKFNLKDYEVYLDYYMDKPVIILICGSIALVALGCLGCLSSILTMYAGIVTFGVLLFGLFMFMIAMTFIGVMMFSNADLAIYYTLEAHVENYTAYSTMIDFIQSNLNCCGVNDFTDWNSTLGYIPGSCCSSDSACGFADVVNLSVPGCYMALQELIGYFVTLLSMVLVALAGLEVAAMALSIFLGKHIAAHRRAISERKLAEQLTQGGSNAGVNNNPLANNRRNDDNANDKNPVDAQARNTVERRIPSRTVSVHPPRGILRHPTHSDVTFSYRSPHENFLSAPPRARYDRRHVIGA